MPRIKIKNFGPIKDGCLENGGWIEIDKVTAFIGNQGSGKSTITKLISTFMWIEKVLFRGDFDIKWFKRKNRFKNTILPYHRLEKYLSKESVIDYQGEVFDISLKDDRLQITEKKAGYALPQIMFVPAERNFVAYVKSPKMLRLASGSLLDFIDMFEEAKRSISKTVELPFNNVKVNYDRLNDRLNLLGPGYRIPLFDAASGFMSVVPLYLVSSYLAQTVININDDNAALSGLERENFKKELEKILTEDMPDEMRKIAISSLVKRFVKKSFVNIVEEPEQNLFPSSQWNLMKKLLEINNSKPANRFIFSTHSPYIISYLSLNLKAYMVKQMIEQADDKTKSNALEKLKNLQEISLNSLIAPGQLNIYQVTDNGSVSRLPETSGIPSDNNFLYNYLDRANNLYDDLLEIEDMVE